MTAARGRALACAALVAIVFVVAWSARASEGRRALVESDGALSRGDLVDAILAARAAAEARCPACSAPDAGFARLESIARDAEKRGDDATAFAAWRAIRSAVLAGAPFGKERRARADAEVARLGHRLEVARVAGASAPATAAAEDRLLVALAHDATPSGATYALLGAGGLLFLYGAARLASARQRPLVDAGLAAAGAGLAAAGTLLF